MENKACNNNVGTTSGSTINTDDKNFVDFTKYENFGMLETMSFRSLAHDIAKSFHKNNSNQ